MAWVSPKVYAILSSSEEGKDIIERLGDMTPEECEKELDAFFGAGGKGEKSGGDYSKAREDDEAEERAYREQGDAEVSDEDFDESDLSKYPTYRVSKEDLQKEIDSMEDYEEEEIRTAIDDNSWSVTDNDTAYSYANMIAMKLGCSPELVMHVMGKDLGREIKEDEKMAEILNIDEEEEEQPSQEEKDTKERKKVQEMRDEFYSVGEEEQALIDKEKEQRSAKENQVKHFVDKALKLKEEGKMSDIWNMLKGLDEDTAYKVLDELMKGK